MKPDTLFQGCVEKKDQFGEEFAALRDVVLSAAIPARPEPALEIVPNGCSEGRHPAGIAPRDSLSGWQREFLFFPAGTRAS